MKIVFTGNPAADYFYPIIAVAEELNTIIDDENLADINMYYMSSKPFDKRMLYENGINFIKTLSGSSRFSISSFMGALNGVIQTFSIFPDVIFSTGGVAAYPTLFAARLLRIPVIVHESNSTPDSINAWSKDFAYAVTTAYKQEIDFFEKGKLIHVGQPIRHSLKEPIATGAYEFLNLEENTPILWIIGGTRGSKNINRIIEEALPELLNHYQVVHQTGEDDFEDMKLLTDATLINHKFKYRYHPFSFLNQLSMKMMAGVSDMVISRAGSSLFEIAYWEIPSIIIPITKSRHNHQIKNAYNYAREGGCIVIEENNLSDQGLIFEIKRIIGNEKVRAGMKAGARSFALRDAGEKIAKEIIEIVLVHEK
ncbi:MAG: glycosyltransferase [Candidatus Pacebacteria bacterium]|nr:glycosyltransferase [Candidatus Paceibacterota bacterium]